MLRLKQFGAFLFNADPAPAGGGAPATPPATPPAGANPPAPPATPPADLGAPAPVNMTSDQLKERLGQAGEAATRKLLKDLGFEKPEDVKAAITKLKELETAGLSEQEKLKKSVEELTPFKAQAEGLAKQFGALVDAQFKALPENVQKAISDRAGDDPQKRFELMQFHAAASAAPAGNPAVPPATPPAPPAPPGPGNVGPTTPPPPPGGTLTKFQEWEAMKQRNPLLGDFFYQNNQREIERTRPA